MSNVARSAKVVVLDAAGRALLLRRSGSHPEFAQHADLPGGTIVSDETYEQGVLRELYEETGITTEQISGIHRLYMGTFYEPNKGVTMERLLFGMRLYASEPAIMLSSEHSEYAWVAISELKDVEAPYQGGIRYANLYDLWAKVT